MLSMEFKQESKIVQVFRRFQTKVLILPRFDLFLQGALLILIFLETSVLYQVRKDAKTGMQLSNSENIVVMIAGAFEFLLATWIGWLGRRRRQLFLSIIFGITGVVGLLIIALPHDDVDEHLLSLELCGDNNFISAYNTGLAYNTGSEWTSRSLILAVLVILCSISKLSIFSHGITYLDDHEPKNGPLFYGVQVSILLSLGFTSKMLLFQSSVSDVWWEAQTALSSLLIMFSMLFALFPTIMNQYEHVKEINYDDAGFFTTLRALLKNKVIIIQSISTSLLSTGLFGFIYFETYFVQGRFHVDEFRTDPRSSRFVGNIFRSITIIFLIAVFRYRFSVRRLDGIKSNTAARVAGIVAIFSAAIFAGIAGLTCDRADIEGLNSQVYTKPLCSSNCGCDFDLSSGFSPVCVLNSWTTYMSPCHTGCNEYEDLNGFILLTNCTCGFESRAIRGSCQLPACTVVFSIYQILLAIAIASSGAALLLQGMTVLRAVKENQKAMAIGLYFSLIAIINKLPGHFLYVIISDWTCAYKVDDVCVFHNPSIWWMVSTTAILIFISAIINIIVSRVASRKKTEL